MAAWKKLSLPPPHPFASSSLKVIVTARSDSPHLVNWDLSCKQLTHSWRATRQYSQTRQTTIQALLGKLWVQWCTIESVNNMATILIQSVIVQYGGWLLLKATLILMVFLIYSLIQFYIFITCNFFMKLTVLPCEVLYSITVWN